MNFRGLRRKALDLNVNLRDAYVAAGIDRLTYWQHSHKRGSLTEDQSRRVDEAILLLAAGRVDHRRTIWSRKLRPMMVRLRHFRGQSTGEVEDRIGVTTNLVAKWECEIRHPNGFMMNCWAEAMEAQLRPIPNELVAQIDGILEAFYARDQEAA